MEIRVRLVLLLNMMLRRPAIAGIGVLKLVI